MVDFFCSGMTEASKSACLRERVGLFPLHGLDLMECHLSDARSGPQQEFTTSIMNNHSNIVSIVGVDFALNYIAVESLSLYVYRTLDFGFLALWPSIVAWNSQ